MLVCRSYGGLLLASNVLCWQLLFRRDGDTFDDVCVVLARSLALYHFFPIARAGARIRQGRGRSQEQGQQGQQASDALGGPVLHLVVHLILLVSLLWVGVYGKAP